jgi:hypothetical protein
MSQISHFFSSSEHSQRKQKPRGKDISTQIGPLEGCYLFIHCLGIDSNKMAIALPVNEY